MHCTFADLGSNKVSSSSNKRIILNMCSFFILIIWPCHLSHFSVISLDAFVTSFSNALISDLIHPCHSTHLPRQPVVVQML